MSELDPAPEVHLAPAESAGPVVVISPGSRLRQGSALALALLLGVHVGLLLAALGGRESFVLRAEGTFGRALAPIAGIGIPSLVVLSLVLLGVGRPSAERPGPRWPAVVAGSLGLAFFLYHLVQVGGPFADPRAAYEVLRIELGQPIPATAYAMGLPALFLFLGHLLVDAVPKTWRWRRPACIASIALVAVLWFLSVQTFAYFATGAPLLGAGHAASSPP